jgi:hypothetical protein
MKALALFSGGLDSSLAAKIIADQGIEVTVVHFVTPFCHCDAARGCRCDVVDIAKELKLALKSVYLGDEYVAMVKNPKYGYGKNLNPCIDCKILMLQRAKKLMEETGASFIVTGEVLGQRPKSQHRQALGHIERDSGLHGLVIRPLSALLLEPTVPEQKGWVQREKLFRFNGRERRPQLDLARALGVTRYTAPAGGCLLTDPHFCKRLKDLLTHAIFDADHVILAKAGRYFRLGPRALLIVGRDELGNKKLLQLGRGGDLYFQTLDVPGPAALGRGDYDESTKKRAAEIVAYYACGDKEIAVTARTLPEGAREAIRVKGMPEAMIEQLRI